MIITSVIIIIALIVLLLLLFVNGAGQNQYEREISDKKQEEALRNLYIKKKDFDKKEEST